MKIKFTKKKCSKYTMCCRLSMLHVSSVSPNEMWPNVPRNFPYYNSYLIIEFLPKGLFRFYVNGISLIFASPPPLPLVSKAFNSFLCLRKHWYHFFHFNKIPRMR